MRPDARDMCARILVLALLFSIPAFGSRPALAQNENEQIGFSSKHLFDGDYFGEDVDLLNGNLVITIPIGPSYKVAAGLEYKLLLTYNSKVWTEKDGVDPVDDDVIMAGSRELPWDGQTAKQVHNAGLGFRLHLGRIFYSRGIAESALDEAWYYQDQNGTNHPLLYCPEKEIQNLTTPRSDPADSEKPICPTSQDKNHFETMDMTYVRASKIFEGSAHVGWELLPGDGTKHTFRHRPDRTQECPGNLTVSDPRYDGDSAEIRGFYVTRIEGVEKYVYTAPSGQKTIVPHNFIDVTYDTCPNDHSIKRIDEYQANPEAGERPSLPSRTISFLNVSTLNVPDCNPGEGLRQVAIHGGLVKSVNLPAFGGARAEYEFDYCIDNVSAPPAMSNCNLSGCGDSRDHVFSSVPLLQRLTFPATPPLGRRETMEFSYADQGALRTGTHGELTERRLPGGAITQYEYDYYSYGMVYLAVTSGFGVKVIGTGGQGCACTDTRQLIERRRFDSAGDITADVWTYFRPNFQEVVDGLPEIQRNPTRVEVTDPENNQTIYYYWSNDNESVFHFNGLNYRTETYRGERGAGDILQVEHSRYVRAGSDLPARRASLHKVDSEVEFAEGSILGGRNPKLLKHWSFDSYGNEMLLAEEDIDTAGRARSRRKTLRTWKVASELTPFEKQNWLVHQLLEERKFTGLATLRSRTLYTLTPEGRVRAESRLARPESGPTDGEDLTTVYCYDGDDMVGSLPEQGMIFPVYDPTATQTGCSVEPNPDRVRTGNVVLKRVSGGATPEGTNPPTREIEYWYHAGAYLSGKRFRENGIPLGWWALNRQRDPSTGLIGLTYDTAGVVTRYSYDELGRLTKIEPDSRFGSEHPTEVRYPSLTRTVVLQGAPAALAAISYEDASPCAEGGDFSCTEYKYDGHLRLIETLKRRDDGTLAKENRCYTSGGLLSEQSEWVSGTDAFECGLQSGGAPRTRTYYTPFGSSRVDPLGRPRRVQTADGWFTEHDYSGQKTVIKVHGINRVPDPVPSNPDPAGIATTVQERDSFGRLVRVDSDAAADAVYTYDEDDRLIEVALGVFDTTGVFSSTTPVQRRHFVYDALGRLTEETNPENGRTHYLAFDPLGNVLLRQDARGIRIRSSHDAAGRPQREELEAGGDWVLLTQNEYDVGRLGAGSDLALGKLTRTDSHDDSGLLVSRRDLRYTGLNGRMDQEEQLLKGWTTPLRTTYRFNSFGTLEQIEYPGDPGWSRPLLASYQYANGYLVRAETLNAQHNLLASGLTYNFAGGLRSWEGGNGTRTTILPDLRNRPSEITVDRLSVNQLAAGLTPPLQDDEYFTALIAQLKGTPHRFVGQDLPEDSELAPLEPEAQATTSSSPPKKDGGGGGGGGGGGLENTYALCHDNADNDADTLVDCLDPTCATFCSPENSYDLCTNLVDDDSNGFTDCFDASCQSLFCATPRTQTEATGDGCGDEIDNDWDSLIDCADPDCTGAGSSLCRYWWSGRYRYDGAGNVSSVAFSLTSLERSSANDLYTYDKSGRLTWNSLANAGRSTMEFVYDPFGNMASWRKIPNGLTQIAVSRIFAIDSLRNQISSATLTGSSSKSFRYDAAGNLTADDRYLYELDSRNRLVRIRDHSGALVSEFTYDASSKRLSRTEGAKTTYYARNPEGNVLTEFLQEEPTLAPFWSKSYLQAGSQQVGFLSAGLAAPQAPEKTAARVFLDGNKLKVRVYWKSVFNAEYYVYRRTGAQPPSALFSVSISGNWYDDADLLVDGQTYYYSVQAVDRYGTRNPLSPEFRVVYKNFVPVAPTWANPWAVVDSSSVTVRWVASTSPYVTGYRVRRGSTSLNESISCTSPVSCVFPTVATEYRDEQDPGGSYQVCALGLDSSEACTESRTAIRIRSCPRLLRNSRRLRLASARWRIRRMQVASMSNGRPARRRAQSSIVSTRKSPLPAAARHLFSWGSLEIRRLDPLS